MQIITTVSELQSRLNLFRIKKGKIGFVPTMGALHRGHTSLIRKSVSENMVTVCSIFVNPSQFDDKKDLDKYPRTLEKDSAMLKAVGCDIVFAPSVEEVYPPDLLVALNIDFGSLDKTMEGAFRIGHFKGMSEVVKRFLDIVQPDNLYMGQKDFQQYSIVKNMIEQLGLPVRIVSCPIIREIDGLAMSSRNIRLSPEGRIKAAKISKILFEARKNAETLPLDEVKRIALAQFSNNSYSVDYFSIVDTHTLEEVQNLEDANQVVLCTTIRVDGVRLLDNIILK